MNDMNYSDTLAQSAGENMLVGIILILSATLMLSSLAFLWFTNVSANTDKLDGKLEDGKAIAYVFFRIYAGLAIIVTGLATWALSLGLQIQF